MALDFPSNPTLNQIYTYGGRSWQWNGTAWDVYNTTNVVNYLNGLTGGVTLSGGTYINITAAGGIITISSPGDGPSGYVSSFNGLAGAVTGVSTVRGLTGTVGITNSSGIGLSVSGQTLTFSNTGVLSVNGSTGTITNIAKINVDNNFTSAQSFVDPSLSASSSNISYNKISFYSDGASVYNNWVPSFGLLDSTITFPSTSGTLALTSGVVSSYNGRTGAVQGVSSASAGTGISLSGSTGAITITNIGVQSFNGFTGAVTGVTTGTANTFVALQSFTTGISASGGVTFAGTLQGTTANFTGLVSSTVGFSGAGTNIIGNASGLTAGNATRIVVTDGNTDASYYPVFVGGTGSTAAYIDKTTTPFTYNPFFGTITLQNVSVSGNVSGNIITRNISEAVVGDGIYIQTQGGPIWLQDNFGNGGPIVLDTWGNINLGDVSGNNNNNILSISDANGTVDFGNMSLQSINYITSTTIQSPTITGTVTLNGQTFTNILSSLNGLTGAKSILAGTGISVTSSNSGITLTNTGVQTFNGLTGAVTGVTTGTANTFVALQSFTTGISASGGVTLSGNVSMTSTSSHTGLASFLGGISAGGGTFSGQLNSQNLKMLTVGGDEGGQVDFGLAATNTSLTGGVAIDIYQNKVRIFETGGNNRGAYIDLTNMATGVGTDLTNGIISPVGMTSGSVRVITYPDGVTTSGSKTPYYQPALLTYQVFNPSFTAYANRTYFTLHHTPRSVSIKTLRFTGANTVTTGNCYFSVWSVDPVSGFPATRLYVSASTAVGSGYTYTSVTNASGLVTVPSGLFYIAVSFDSTPTVYCMSMSYTLSAYGSGNMAGGYSMTTPVVDTSGFTAPSSITATGVTFSIIDYTSTYRTGVLTEFGIV
jgi:hypothetical protein